MLFQLKDDTVLKVSPKQVDEHYDEGWCETCGGEWVDEELTIEITYGSDTLTTLEYFGEDAKDISVSGIINFLILKQEAFPLLTRLEFEEEMKNYFQTLIKF